MRRWPLAWLLLSALLLIVPLTSQAAVSDPLPAILATIDGGELKALATQLAGPEYRGRMTGEPELYNAAGRIESLWSEWGVRKVDPATYQQGFTVLSSRVVAPSSCTLVRPHGSERTYTEVEDFQPFPYGGMQPVEGEVVFVGYGITAPDLGYDDYAGVDVAGKIVFVLRHAPGHDMARFGDHATFIRKGQTAHEHGAAGMVLVTDPNEHEDFAPMDFPSAAVNYGENFAAIYLHTQHAQEWFAPSGQVLASLQTAIDTSGQPLSFPLGIRATLHAPTKFVEQQPTVNVVGWIEGAHPTRKREVIVVGAHLDHLGYRGERIYPGADDNCSGTVALLGVARALATAKTRPARSIVFVHFSGEEMGLLGSSHYVQHQLLPPNTKIVAMLNMDMVGLGNGGVTTLVPQQGGGDRLQPLVEPTAKRYLEGFGDWPLNFGEAQGNSDHAPFADAGIPALFFVSSGDHPDYHQPGDTPDKLQAPILERCAQLCTAMAWRVAQEGVPTRKIAWTVTDTRRYHAHDEVE